MGVGGGFEITLIITATGGLIIYGLRLVALALYAARVQELVHQELWGDVSAIPEEAKRRVARMPGEGGVKATRSQSFARHIAHDGSGL